ncbi:hypothetical protein BS47DRAFT_1388384 [Hydnum rufescens UP504]|uniref:Uncharacterized protein n=1 Tax=Hydnum rufescens UP504 TaxID=1448309 RepID=A0A9P6E1X4_9AGAM|nr:hypothetical protein BS47DRAFT_1388384 [Hydnum rufescens UP504]
MSFGILQRRVASLPPVSVKVFNQKVLNKRVKTAITNADRGAACEVSKHTVHHGNCVPPHLSSTQMKYPPLLRPPPQPLPQCRPDPGIRFEATFTLVL